MGLLAWLRNAMGPNHSRRFRRNGPTRQPAARCRLTLEALEDRNLPSTITGLGYSTYLGNSYGGNANAVAVDNAGNACVTGNIQQGNYDHLFVTKFHPDGSLAYSTLLGGSGNDYGLGIAVDSSGNTYVTGETSSTDFPTKNAFQNTYGGGSSDAFLTKLDPNGALLYSTYLGGNGSEDSWGALPSGSIAVDAAGNAYLTGVSGSTNFPTTGNALLPTFPAGGASFVTKLNTNLSGAASLVYSTYLSGAATRGIAMDSSGNAYLTGNAASATFPTTPGAFMTTGCGFISKLNADGSALVYSSFVNTGGLPRGIAVDGAGNACVTGETLPSAVIPTTPGTYQTTKGGMLNAFVTKVNAAGSGLVYSTYLGSTSAVQGYAIALDSAGHIFVTGYAGYDFPTKNASQPIQAGGTDAFLAELDPSQSEDASLVYSSFLGGELNDYGYGIAVDGADNVIVAGKTSSQSFPTVNAYQATYPGGTVDAFVTKVLPPPANATSITLASSLSPAVVGQSVTFTATVTATAAGAGRPDGTVIFLDDSTTLETASLDAAGQASFTTSALAWGAHSIKAVYIESTPFQESASPVLVQVEIGSQASSASLKSSANPLVYGQALTLTATVKAASGSAIPTGTVTFLNGSTVLGTGALTSSGVATVSTSALAAGSHALTAVYGGDGNFAPSTTPVLTQTVNLTATKTTLKSSASKSAFGQPVSFTATVTAVAPGAGTPTGTITFMDGSTVLGTVTLVNGQATFTTSTLSKGKHSISAVYSGDVDFVTSAAATLIQTIS
jgi:hypothetical protein